MMRLPPSRQRTCSPPDKKATPSRIALVTDTFETLVLCISLGVFDVSSDYIGVRAQ